MDYKLPPNLSATSCHNSYEAKVLNELAYERTGKQTKNGNCSEEMLGTIVANDTCVTW